MEEIKKDDKIVVAYRFKKKFNKPLILTGLISCIAIMIALAIYCFINKEADMKAVGCMCIGLAVIFVVLLFLVLKTDILYKHKKER